MPRVWCLFVPSFIMYIMKKNNKHLSKWIQIGLALLVIMTYANGFQNDFTSDDISLFTNSHSLGNWSTITSQGVYFFQSFIYVIIYKIFGPIAMWYRLVSVLFHTISVQMVFLIVSTLLSPIAGVFIASLFAVHPLAVESVTWISGGPYAWSTSFFLISFYLYIRSSKNQSNISYILSIGAYCLSLSAGLTAAALAGVYVLYEYCFGSIVNNWRRIIPFFLLSLVFGLIALSNLDTRVDAFEQTLAWEIPEYSIWNIPFILSKYLELFIWPIGISHYQVDVLGPPLRIAVFLLFVTASIYSFLKSKYIFFGLSLFIVSLIPSLVPVGVHWLVADRYVYVGLIGLSFVIGILFYFASRNPKYQSAIYLVFAVYIVLLQVRTMVRNNDWKNELNLWKSTVRTSPEDPKGHNNLANSYILAENYQEAFKELEIAIQLKPNYSDAYHNVGFAYSRSGNTEEAEKYFKLALSHNPKQWQSYHNLGLIYNERKEYMVAADFIKKAIEVNPQYAVLYTDLGVMYYFDGQHEKAQEAFLKALSLDPSSQMARMGYEETLK